MLITILLFLVVIGVLVFVHELGHFLVAKWNGIKSEEFGFGFPPRLIGVYKDTQGKWQLLLGNKKIEWRKGFFGSVTPVTKQEREEYPEYPNTIYSLNWIPLGGFVKIKGEEASFSSEPDSFAGKPAWTRIKVMGAGVFMNMLLAWLLFSIVFMIGLPQPIDPEQRGQYPDTQIQVAEVKAGTPAALMGLEMGDEIVSIAGEKIENQEEVRDIILAHRGEEITIEVRRFNEKLTLSGTPRQEYSADEGALGFAYAETAIINHPWYEAIQRGFVTTYTLTWAILEALSKMIAYLFGGEKVDMDIAGPVGIVLLTKQMNDLGLTYLLQFAAILSINLAIINILPIPALDGGRILFVLIEKLKGRPVSQSTEGRIHHIGFILLLLLMLLVTIRDFAQFNILQRIGNFF